MREVFDPLEERDHLSIGRRGVHPEGRDESAGLACDRRAFLVAQRATDHGATPLASDRDLFLAREVQPLVLARIALWHRALRRSGGGGAARAAGGIGRFGLGDDLPSVVLLLVALWHRVAHERLTSRVAPEEVLGEESLGHHAVELPGGHEDLRRIRRVRLDIGRLAHDDERRLRL